MKRFCSLLASTLALAAIPADAITSVSVGAFYVRGDYGADSDTSMNYAPVTLAWREQSFKLGATMSYLAIDGVPGNTSGVIDGNGALPASGESEGLGDSFLKASYDISSNSRRLLLRPLVKVKIPTADENRGLGTGSTDYTVQLDAFYYVAGWWPYVSAGYRWRGDSTYEIDEGTGVRKYSAELENAPVFGAGFYKPLSAATSITLAYEHRAPSVVHLAATEEMLLTFQQKIDAHWTGSMSAGTGFTHRSADEIIGIQLEYRY